MEVMSLDKREQILKLANIIFDRIRGELHTSKMKTVRLK